jgi:hypothetical protein
MLGNSRVLVLLAAEPPATALYMLVMTLQQSTAAVGVHAPAKQ